MAEELGQGNADSDQDSIMKFFKVIIVWLWLISLSVYLHNHLECIVMFILEYNIYDVYSRAYLNIP